MDLNSLLRRGLESHQRGDLASAQADYEQVLAAKPGHPRVTYLMGALRALQGSHQEALALLQQAHAGLPGDPAVLLHMGNALQELDRPDEAVSAYDQALALKPDYAEAMNNRANALGAAGRDSEALAAFDLLVARWPQDAGLRYNRGNLLLKLNRNRDALADFDAALALKPDLAEAWNNRGTALRALHRLDEGLASYEKALSLLPGYAEFEMNRATVLAGLKRFNEALAGYDRVQAQSPSFDKVWGESAAAALYGCDWSRRAGFAAEMRDRIAAGEYVHPWVVFGYFDDSALHRRRAEFAVQEMAVRNPPPLWRGERYGHDRIRLAYVSFDLRDHPVGQQLVEVIERHDPARFEVIGISTGFDDGSELRRRFQAGFDRFIDMQGESHAAVAQKLRELEIDIALELNGYTEGNALAAFAWRPAPVQVEWLGYAGTTGADFMDAVIVDGVLAPPERQADFCETLVALPHSFFPMDTRRALGAVPTRADQGLPETGFVFCCFNNNWKITPDIFDIWMRLLKAVPGSVLWLRGGSENHLKREAGARGVAPERLVFAGHAPADVHLARHRLADLFLDTLPYNAHATAADALWAGLPVLTRAGQSFPSRVAASLVTAAGLPELVTRTAADYEALALALARDPARLKALRDRLAQRDAPLFDTGRFTRDLEDALAGLLRDKVG